jgi:membrane-bound serine protease (ClpP class)
MFMAKLIACLVLASLFFFAGHAQKAIRINVDATINPATADFIARAIKRAGNERAACLIIRLNTPGGLLESTRKIVGEILEAPVPVIVYVAPGGAHAGSAGVFITMAAHVAAMAPGTNIGAAHPVSMQGGMDSTLGEKATNDAAAFIRTIAEKRKRNMEWAEDAVRNSVSITATEALEKKVIDMVAASVEEVLDKAEGMAVEMGGSTATLHTKAVPVEEMGMTFAEKLLNLISNPNIAYLLLMLGFYGILFELYNPGSIFPGIIGAIGLILGFYSLNTLPMNYAGLALIILGIILLLLEIKITSYGMLTIGGVISLFLGSIMLIRPDSPLELSRISRGLIIGTTLASAGFFVFVVGMGIRAQRRKPVTGSEGFTGETGEAVEELNPIGNVLVHGELWQAESVAGTIAAGQRIKVTGRRNFKLFVEPIQTTK